MSEFVAILTVALLIWMIWIRPTRFKTPKDLRRVIKKKWPGVEPTTPESLSALLSHTDIADQILTPEIDTNSWKSDPITPAQEARLKTNGIKITKKSLKTKGIGSKLIGLSIPSDAPHINDYLEYFGYDTDEMSETRAAIEYQNRTSNPDSNKMWESRPPTEQHYLYCQYQNIKLPTNATFSEAESIITEHQNKNLTGEQVDEWTDIESLWDDIQDKEFREMAGIKLPKQKEFIAAVKYYQESDKRDPNTFDENLILYFLTLRNAKLKAK